MFDSALKTINLVAIVAWIVATPSLLPAKAPLSTDTSSFAKVEAILTLRCVRCHGSEKSEGGLRLDSKELALKGGDSGSPAISEDLNLSEVYQRIISENPDIRMPSSGSKLSEKQIDAIREWLEEGSPWPTDYSIQLPAPSLDTPPSWLVFVNTFNQRFKPLLLSIVSALFVIFIFEKLRLRRKETSHPSKLLYTSIVTTSLTIGLSLQFFNESQAFSRLKEENEKLRRALKGKPKENSDTPKIYRPQSPPLLSGRWYRGNDERTSDRILFNNGLYTTTTFDLSLTNENGIQLVWGAKAEGELTLNLDLKRAPFATPELFKDSRLKNVTISDALPGIPLTKDNRTIHLSIIESGEFWKAEIPIKTPPQTGNISSVLYLYHSLPSPNGLTSPHYAIGYDLYWKDGHLQKNSEIWMGAIYLTSNVFVPPKDKIMLNEWFSNRPIPFIEDGNTNDPKLLGLPEHLSTNPPPTPPSPPKTDDTSDRPS